MQIQKFALALLLSACGGEFQHSGLLAPFSNKARSEDASQFDPSLSLSLSIQCSTLAFIALHCVSFLNPFKASRTVTELA